MRWNEGFFITMYRNIVGKVCICYIISEYMIDNMMHYLSFTVNSGCCLGLRYNIIFESCIPSMLGRQMKQVIG